MANKHTKAQCEFIVRKLAAFEPPRAIALDFCAVFPDTRCDENDVRRCDPKAGAVLSPELFVLFRETRERVLLDPDSAPLASQTARLIMLNNHAIFHNSNNELAVARAVLRQIAEEQGAVGGKAGAVPAKPGDAGRKITEIIETIIDPAPPPAS